MNKYYIIILLSCLAAVQVPGQGTFNFGSQTTFVLNEGTEFFAGGNTTFGGRLINRGKIISYSDIDFVENTDVGRLSFVGPGIQNVSGDTLLVIDFEVNKAAGEVVLLSEQVRVSGNLNVISGVIESENEEDLIVTGSSQGSDGNVGYVEGNLIGLAATGVLTFPMGINNNPNYITLKTENLNAIFRVTCRVPPVDQLKPTEDMIGISDEVEWLITSLNQDSVEVSITTIFSGVDLENFSNGNFIRAQAYSPTIVKLGPNDTIYQDLGIIEVSNTDNVSFGTVISETPITITREPTHLGVALIPHLLAPVFFIPNAFSPTAALEENRVFRPYFSGANVTALQMQVFDSFQNRLYSANEVGDNIDLGSYGWDGLLSGGNSADEGVYYYSIKVVADGTEYEKVGSFMLIH